MDRHVLEPALEVAEKTDEQLAAEAALEGSDGPAFTALVSRHRQRVWQLCYRLLDNEADAHDAAQEVFVRLFFHRHRFENRSKFTTWMHGIAVRTCLELRRARQRRQRRVATADVEVLEHQAHRPPPGEHLAIDLAAMLDTLDETDRALLILKYAEGYTFEELAEIFDLGTSAVKMRVSRARSRLQQRFSEQEPQ